MKRLMPLIIIIGLVFFFTNAFAVEILVWGPIKYERTSGEPDVYTGTITIAPGVGKLGVKNGQLSGDRRIEDSLSSAKVYINNTLFFGQNDFNKKVYLLEAPINLTGNDEISVELASSPGSYLAIEILKEIELPPDPGEAGKETLLGIDSDKDGVRDDIQRYIYITYPNEEKVRLALFQIARNYQELLPNSADPEISHENVKKLYCSRDCLAHIKGIRTAIRITNAMKAEILNTKKRSLAYLQFNNSLAGKTTSLPEYEDLIKCCPFSVDDEGGQQ